MTTKHFDHDGRFAFQVEHWPTDRTYPVRMSPKCDWYCGTVDDLKNLRDALNEFIDEIETSDAVGA